MSRGLRWLLSVSVALNVLGVAVGAYWLHKHGAHAVAVKLHLASDPPPDYPVLARERFGPLPVAGTVIAGDSQVQNAPLADMLTDFHQRGIGGEDVAQLASWLPSMLTASTRRVVVEAGTNDVLLGHSPQATASVYAAMLDGIRKQAPDARLVMLSVPPLTGHAPQVQAMNAALAQLAGREHAQWVDITSALAGSDGQYVPADTVDGTHLSVTGYQRIAPVLRQVLG